MIRGDPPTLLNDSERIGATEVVMAGETGLIAAASDDCLVAAAAVEAAGAEAEGAAVVAAGFLVVGAALLDVGAAA